MKKLVLTLIATSVIAGCSKKNLDTTPIVTGAVINAEYTIDGQFVPTFSGKQIVHTVSDKRSIRDDVKFSNLLMRWANYDNAIIARIDLNKSYDVDYDDKEYSECPLTGCGDLSSLFDQFKSTDDDEEYQDYDALGCQVNMTKNDLSVVKTGNTRKINGFDVTEYTMVWTTEYQDTAGKADLNEVSFDFWTTDVSKPMNQVFEVHGDFQNNYYQSASQNPLMRLIGEKGYKALAAFTGDMDNQEHQFSGEVGRKLASIKGYPISIKLEWSQKSEACQEEKSVTEGVDTSGGLESVGKQLLSNLMKKGKDKLVDNWKQKPLVRYVYEIKTVNMTTFKESVFAPPAEFNLINRQ